MAAPMVKVVPSTLSSTVSSTVYTFPIFVNIRKFKDDDKFGQRMLERMGWQKGKGLGANEDGKVDHIAVTLKSDNTGVGCTKSHADNWIAHQDDFGALLADLNANHSNTNSGTNTPDTEKVLSLESHSKSAKGRVHYKKFTRSKDLSAKNAQDLNCVFGRRKSKSTSKIQSEAEVINTDPAPGKDKDSNYGVVTTTSKQSVQEYFAQKMAELQQSRDRETESAENGKVAINDFDNAFGAGFGGSGVSCELGVRYEDVEDDYTHSFADKPQGVAQNESESHKKGKRKERIDEREDVAEGGGDLGESIECDVEPSKKKRKKDKKRRKAADEEVVCDVTEVTEKDDVVDEGGDITEVAVDLGKSSDCDVEPSKKKRKKDKKSRKGAVVCDVTEVIEEKSKGKKKKGKKEKKNLKGSVCDENLDEDGVKEDADTAVDADGGSIDEGKAKKKKKKKKKSDKDPEAEEESNSSEVVEEEEKAQKTKMRKGKADVKKDGDGEIKESRGKRKLKGASEKSEAAPKKARRR